MKIYIFAVLALGLAGCVESTGGAGQTRAGDPVAGSLSLDHASQIFDVAIHSPQGWSCSATFQRSGQNLRVRTVPLACSDGRKGTLILSANQFQGQAVGSFRLSDGESGQVVFGNT